jgi:hypothetical protein
MSKSIRERLEEWGNFEDCLLHDVRPIIFGFGVDLVVNYIWRDGGVRENALEVPHLVTLRMLGVDRLCFVGDLSESMKSDPGKINWGLTEIAHIKPVPTSADLGIAVEWEGNRRLEVGFSKLEILVSDEARRQK